jgi:acetylornithine/N-succinyldiaminopimelate aminotransferase
VKLADLLGAGSHGSTFGGTPLGCAVALRIFDVIERDKLADNARNLGDWLKGELQRMVERYPSVLRNVRGLGFMLGIEFAPRGEIPALAASDKPTASQVVQRLHEAGVLTIPAGPQVVRLLPALNLSRSDAEEGLALIEGVVRGLAP